MPFPLPWFNNQVDPLLPLEGNIKPALYNLDDYQTYDFLCFVCPKSLYDILVFSCKGFVPFPVSVADLPIMNRFANGIVFDRFTPWDYPWAEDYSFKLFNFIKNYSYFCPQPLDPNSDLFTFEQPKYDDFIKANIANLKYLPSFNSDRPPFKLNFFWNSSNEKNIILTWLEGDQDVIKRYKILEIKEGVNNINLCFSQSPCACSMVVNGDLSFEKTLKELQPGLVYSNLNSLLKELDDHLNFQLGIFLRKARQKKEFIVNYLVENYWYNHPFHHFAKRLENCIFYNNFSTLLFANNNCWGNQISLDITQDLGKKIFYAPVYKERSNEIIDVVYKLEADLSSETFPPSNFYFDINSVSKLYLSKEERFASLLESSVNIPQQIAIAFLDAYKKLELNENG